MVNPVVLLAGATACRRCWDQKRHQQTERPMARAGGRAFAGVPSLLLLRFGSRKRLSRAPPFRICGGETQAERAGEIGVPWFGPGP